MPSSNLTDIVIVYVLGTVILLALAFFIVLFMFFFRQKQILHLSAQQTLREAYEREILRSQLEIQNDTLHKIGEELHDNIGQLLTLARLQLNALEVKLGTQPSAQAAREANATLKTTLAAVRALSKTLDTEAVGRAGLAESLRLDLDRIGRTGRFATHFAEEGEPQALPPQAELVLFRMAQELLNNAIKHSEASTLTVSILHGEKALALTVADDGLGFTPGVADPRPGAGAGSGLHNLHRRAGLLGGTCTFETAPGQGTRATVRVPYPA